MENKLEGMTISRNRKIEKVVSKFPIPVSEFPWFQPIGYIVRTDFPERECGCGVLKMAALAIVENDKVHELNNSDLRIFQQKFEENAKLCEYAIRENRFDPMPSFLY